MLAGLAGALAEEGLAAAGVTSIVHATTLATNALIERSGARTGMLTTRGFRDVIEVGHEQLYDLYDLHLDLPAPLVPRALRRPVAERTASDGERLEALDEESADAAIRFLVGRGVESIAVCFLHAYANPENERAAAGRIRDLAPELPGFDLLRGPPRARGASPLLHHRGERLHPAPWCLATSWG